MRLASSTLKNSAAITAVLLALAGVPGTGQTAITAPRRQFGFDLGDDCQLASYKQISDYWRQLEMESDRLVVREIGRTAEGRRT